MSDSQSATSPAPPPVPRAPGSAIPRRPRPPKQTGGDLEPDDTPARVKRRQFTWAGLTAFLGAVTVGTVVFFFPRTIREKKTSFKVGFPSDYGIGVDTKYQKEHRIWVVRDVEKIFVILAKCTHLGCTPEWKDSDSKFKCPCHGSGFDRDGINFEGPAPRPMDRCQVTIAPDGQILVNKLRLLGEPEWVDEAAFIPA
jgi:cytochrome b6-f complex iron-sulfur subunit